VRLGAAAAFPDAGDSTPTVRLGVAAAAFPAAGGSAPTLAVGAFAVDELAVGAGKHGAVGADHAGVVAAAFSSQWVSSSGCVPQRTATPWPTLHLRPFISVALLEDRSTS